MPSITHPNGQVTYYQEDDFTDPWSAHETIIIQHGFGRNSNLWYHWIPILARHYRVIRRDARGHGHSSVPDKRTYAYTVDTILDEIIDTLDQLGLQKVHWLGESTGGIWGELLAARNPGRLLSLTICGSPLYMPKEANDLLACGAPITWGFLRANGSKAWAETVAMTLGNGGFSPEHLRWWVSEIARSTSGSLADHGELIWDQTFDARMIMHKIKIPMLLLAPAHSGLVDLPDQKVLHDTVAGSKLEIIEGAGHEIYIDQAEKCQGLFLEFVREVAKAGI